ncbi:MAG: DUF1203 domain-containing protein [Burkholderiales bacterium]|nr:DUF1203 domain-containing protein [Burkholderiales bacterium]
MSYRITGLSAEPYRHLFGLSDTELKTHQVVRCVADRAFSFPDRVELRDAEPGETLLLVNYTHLPVDNPYRASHAIFVREHAETPFDAVDTLPATFQRRLLSIRAFDAAGMMVDADLVEGEDAESLITRMFDDEQVAYLHAHYARRGCFAARIDRA